MDSKELYRIQQYTYDNNKKTLNKFKEKLNDYSCKELKNSIITHTNNIVSLSKSFCEYDISSMILLGEKMYALEQKIKDQNCSGVVRVKFVV